MADAPQIPDEAEVRARWGAFAWSDDSKAKRDAILSRYPAGREQSASIPLLDLAQRQVGAETQTQGWLPVPVIEFVAREIGVPYIRVYEVATFYTMFNLAPVGKYFIQMCGTTPCMLRGSDDIKAVLHERVGQPGHVSADGLFSWQEVECLGACCNAPMVQINDDYYEDLNRENFTKLLDDLAAGREVRVGSQTGRVTSEPVGRLTSLTSLYGDDGKSGPAAGSATPTPSDFPGFVQPNETLPGVGGEAQPAEAATKTLKREHEQSVGRPDPAGQRGDPRQENPVHEHGKAQDAADPGNAGKA